MSGFVDLPVRDLFQSAKDEHSFLEELFEGEMGLFSLHARLCLVFAHVDIVAGTRASMNSQPAWLAEYDAQQEDCRLKMVTILEEFGSLEKLVETLKVAGSGGCCSGGKRSALEQRVEDKISLISKLLGEVKSETIQMQCRLEGTPPDNRVEASQSITDGEGTRARRRASSVDPALFRSDFSQLVSEFVEDMDRWKRYHRIQMIQSSRNNAQYQTNMKEQQRQLRISQNRASDAVAACERVESKLRDAIVENTQLQALVESREKRILQLEAELERSSALNVRILSRAEELESALNAKGRRLEELQELVEQLEAANRETAMSSTQVPVLQRQLSEMIRRNKTLEEENRELELARELEDLAEEVDSDVESDVVQSHHSSPAGSPTHPSGDLDPVDDAVAAANEYATEEDSDQEISINALHAGMSLFEVGEDGRLRPVNGVSEDQARQRAEDERQRVLLAGDGDLNVPRRPPPVDGDSQSLQVAPDEEEVSSKPLSQYQQDSVPKHDEEEDESAHGVEGVDVGMFEDFYGLELDPSFQQELMQSFSDVEAFPSEDMLSLGNIPPALMGSAAGDLDSYLSPPPTRMQSMNSAEARTVSSSRGGGDRVALEAAAQMAADGGDSTGGAAGVKDVQVQFAD